MNNETAGARGNDDNIGVLVGWTHNEFNGKIALRLQSVRSSRDTSSNDVDSHYYFMTKNQAGVLANYLFQLAEQSPVRRRKKGWLSRLLKG